MAKKINPRDYICVCGGKKVIRCQEIPHSSGGFTLHPIPSPKR